MAGHSFCIDALDDAAIPKPLSPAAAMSTWPPNSALGTDAGAVSGNPGASSLEDILHGAARPLRPGSSPADLAMDRLAGGDEAAFGELYDLLAPRLLAYLTRKTRDTARAEDLLQLTMLQLHRQRGRFARGAEVTPWAFAIARRFLLDGYRKDKRRRALEKRLGPTEPQYETATDDVVASMQMARRVVDELSRLPEKQRVVLEMIRQDGLSIAEVAQVLGISENAIKLRVQRAYVTLHAAVVDGGGDDAK